MFARTNKIGTPLDLIVVGAADNDGASAGLTEGGDSLAIYAVGTNVVCPVQGSPSSTQTRDGTSCGMLIFPSLVFRCFL